ncbi:MAG: CHASE2 domain-containing protein [Paracoccaceae bacterium]
MGSFFYSDKFIFLENISLDSLQKTFPRNTNENKIFIIDIDEISLEKIGQWPWDRSILAELTKTLKESYNVKVIGFDIIFPEKDRLSDLNLDERDNDTIFSKSIEEVRNVVLPLSLSTSNPSLVLPVTRSNINTIGFNNYDHFKTENSFITNLDELNRFSEGLGYINSTSDRDGLIRKLFLVNNFVSQTEGTKLIPSFSLELARVFLDEKKLLFKKY